MTATPTGAIRLDSNGDPYLTQTPAKNIVHVVYQQYALRDIGTIFTTLYSTKSRDMVNGINHLYNTCLKWEDMKGKTIEFFNPETTPPFIRLTFDNVGEYYTAEVSVDKTLQIDMARPATELTTLVNTNNRPEKDVVYYTTQKNVGVLTNFLSHLFCVKGLSFSPNQAVDFSFVLFEGDDFLTPVVLRNYSNNGGYSTLLFENEVIPVIDLQQSSNNPSKAITILASILNINVKNISFVGATDIKVFDPVTGLNEEYSLFPMKRAGELKYLVATDPVTMVALGRGPRGYPGKDGKDGADAYKLAVRNGFTGTEQEWLSSLPVITDDDVDFLASYILASN